MPMPLTLLLAYHIYQVVTILPAHDTTALVLQLSTSCASSRSSVPSYTQVSLNALQNGLRNASMFALFLEAAALDSLQQGYACSSPRQRKLKPLQRSSSD